MYVLNIYRTQYIFIPPKISSDLMIRIFRYESHLLTGRITADFADEVPQCGRPGPHTCDSPRIPASENSKVNIWLIYGNMVNNLEKIWTNLEKWLLMMVNDG